MQKNAAFGFLLPALLVLFQCASQSTLVEVSEETGVGVEMRDGVSLVADIYRPDSAGEYPVLLQRTPYNRKGGAADARTIASNGYIVVLQDTRGRYDSEGEWYPFRHEAEDGYDTVEWAAALEGSNGRVGMFGGSYVGATQMLASTTAPPRLVAIFPYVTASEYYDSWTYQSGAFMQWFAQSWTSGLAQDTLRRNVGSEPKEWAPTLPVEEYPVLEPPDGDELAPYLDDWVAHETDDSYWKRWKISDHYGAMDIKALHSGGWHDIFLKGSIQNYIGMRDGAKTEEARASQRLLIGPWAHDRTTDEGGIGEVEFGSHAVLDMTGTIIEWSNWALKGEANRYADGAPVRIFVMGENAWREEREFPLQRQRLTRYYLHAERGANGIGGDGVLSTDEPAAGRPDVFTYDPADPVPTIGGRLCCANDLLKPGPHDQRPNESRADVLVFSTPPLESDVEVTGFIKLELFASSSAVDTDFTAMLVDVNPDGYARLLTDGVVRVKYRNSLEKAELATPGEVYRHEVDLWATSNVFLKGHQIRLYVSSSNFPRFNRNLNTGEPMQGATRMAKAKQTIYHDTERPSALLLPVIPR